MYDGLEKVISKDKIKYNESMKKHTTMKVGGNADCLVIAENLDDILNVTKFAKENNIPLTVIGMGSNIVVEDGGILGIVLKISAKFEDIKINKTEVTVTSGTSMPKLAIVLRNNNLSGFEFACGIPGTIGGGVRMNAGAYGSEISKVLKSVKYIDDNLEIKEITNEECNFGYRKSIFTFNPKYVIIEATFTFQNDSFENISNRMNDNRIARSTKQPLEYPSAGSVFKRPEGYFAGKLITDAGLKGKLIGGAMVSTKHAGFIINYNNATCEDIKNLIKHIQKTIYDKFNVNIETEVQFIGRK